MQKAQSVQSSDENSGTVGIGDTTPEEKLTVNGNLSVSGNCRDGGASTTCDITADIAEAFNVSNNKNVLGVVSTAPTIVMGRLSGGVAVALTGVVPVKATNENGNIGKGDLLTTSSRAGYAMKCDIKEVEDNDDFEALKSKTKSNEKCRNSILGKALEPCNESECRILALVALQ